MKKRILSMLLAIVMVAGLVPGTALAAETSGTTGENTWSYDASTKTLTISGAGAMGNGTVCSDHKGEIEKIVIEAGVTSIGQEAFYGYTALTEIEISNTVTSIGKWAINGCTALESITIPASVTSIEAYAFARSTKLTEITYLGATAPTYDSSNSPFNNLGEITILVPSEYSSNYFCGKAVTKIESGTTGEVNWSYNTATKMLTVFGSGAMGSGTVCSDHKSEIQKIVIEAGVTSIGQEAFYGYTALTEIEISNTVTSIGKWAINGCTALESITIPASVTSIEAYAFARSTKLTEITYLGATAPTYDSSNSPFNNLGEITILVPSEYSSNYFCGKAVTKQTGNPNPTTYTVTVTNDGNGTASATPASGGEGAEVILTANANDGYQFKEWQVVSGGVTVTDNKFTIGTENVEVKAVFEVIPVTNYDLWVGGSQVTSANLSGTGWSFAPDSNILTLTGADITGVTDNTASGYKSSGIYSELDALNIVVTADSTVTGANSTGAHSVGIYSTGSIAISGSGKLTATGGSSSVSSGVSSGILAKELVIDGAKVDAIGGTANNGTSAGIGGSGAMTLTVNGASVVNATGNKRGIHLYGGSFTVNGGEVNVKSTASDAFYAGGTRNINGGTVICQAAEGYKAIGGSFTTTVEGKTIRYIYEDGTSTTDYQRDNAQILASNYIKLTVGDPDPAKYKLWFYTDGGKVTGEGIIENLANSQYYTWYEEGKGITFPTAEALSRDDYRFWCWSWSGSQLQPAGSLGTTATGDRIIYAYWKELHDLTITSTENGTVSASVKQMEDGDVIDNAAVAAKDDTVTLTITPKAGYDLADISVKDANNADVTLSGEGDTRTFKMPAGSVIVAATFEQAKVTFNANGGTGTMDAVTVSDASYILPLCDFTAPVTGVPGGMVFAGWAYSANGDVITTDDITVGGNTELFAIWEYTPVLNQTIEKSGVFNKQHTFDIDLGALLPTDAKIKVGATISSAGIVAATTTPTYVVGSNTASLKIVTKIKDAPVSDTVVMTIDTENYGKFTFTVNVTLTGYTIAYELDGGSMASDNPTDYSEESETFTLTNPTKTGYTFKGWSGTDLTGDENQTVTITAGSTGDRTYTANWTANTYTVKFDANGGDGTMADMSFTYGESKNLTANTFTYANKHFNGWNTAADGSGTAYAAGATVGNLTAENGGTVTLYAQWIDKPAPDIPFLPIIIPPYDAEIEDSTTGTDVDIFEEFLGLYTDMLLNDDSRLGGGFTDVFKSDWFYSDVTALANRGVVSGYPDGSFRPQGIVTWGEALKLVMKAVGYGDIAPTNDHWASGYMDMAIEKLLISGEVDLDAAITRGEMADLTARAMKLGKAAAASPFDDEAPDSAVVLYEAGIIKGSADNGRLLFRAESTITRAEMAAVIWRVYCAR